MKNKIQINLGADHALESTEKVIGRAGEGLVSRLEIAVPEALSNYDAYIDFEKPNGETLRTPRLEVEYGVAYYDVPQYLLAENGDIKVQLVFEKANGSVWKSSKKRYTILKSINAVEDIPNKEDFITQAQKLIDELNQEVEEIADVLANDYKFAQAVIEACGGQRKITTINGIALRFFLGKKEDFDELSDYEKQNVFAIFTDDTARAEILTQISTLTERLNETDKKLTDALSSIDNNVVDEENKTIEMPIGSIITIGDTANEINDNLFVGDIIDFGNGRVITLLRSETVGRTYGRICFIGEWDGSSSIKYKVNGIWVLCGEAGKYRDSENYVFIARRIS